MWITIYVNDFAQFILSKNFVQNVKSTHETTHRCFLILLAKETGHAK